MCRQGAEPGAPVELLVGGPAAQLFAQRFRGVNDQRLELSDCFGAGDDSALAGGKHHPHRLTVPAGTRSGEVVTGERFAGSADSVEVVGFGPVAPSGSGWTVDLDDPLTPLKQMGSQPGSEAAGSFDSPDPRAGCVFVSEGDDAAVSHGIG
jgi:hypothetical protein